MASVDLNQFTFTGKTTTGANINGSLSSSDKVWTAGSSNTIYVTLNSATYNTATKQLALSLKYNKSSGGYYIPAVYFSLNEDRTSLGNSSTYQSLNTSGDTYCSTGPGEYYFIWASDKKNVNIPPNTASTATINGKVVKTALTSTGTDINNSTKPQTTYTVTLYATVEPSQLSAISLYIRCYYNGTWPGLNNTKWYQYSSSNTKSTGEKSAVITTTTTIPSYTLSYDRNGGSSTPSSVTALQDQVINLAPAISRSDESRGSGNYTITFNMNGGTGGPSTWTGAYSYITKYSFSKWNYGGTNYDPGQSFTMPASNVTMQATWNITYQDNNPTYTVSSTIPSKSGYSFQYWQDGNSNTYRIGNSYTINSNRTLTAIWQLYYLGKIRIKVNGSWRDNPSQIKVKAGGTWHDSKVIYVKVNGTWTQAWRDPNY